MSKSDDGGAAFPGMMHHDETGYGGGVSYTPEGGMSIRDYFAAKAMQAILHADHEDTMTHEAVAKMAYRQADAMLLARKGNP